MKKSVVLIAALSALMLTGCEVILTKQDSTAQQNSNAQQNSSVQIPLQPTEPNAAPSNGYRQNYPVQPFQKAYARFLSEPNSPWFHSDTIYMVHINADTIPELILVPDSHTAIVYSFDGTEVYKVGTTGLDSRTYDFRYRPYLNMISYDSDSNIYGDTYKVVQTFTVENGRLCLGKQVNIAGANGETPQNSEPYLKEYKDTIPYDIGEKDYCSYGSSWRHIGEETKVTKQAVEYWLYQ